MVAEAVIVSVVLCLSGVSAEAKTVCALKGSSVDLSCSAENPTSGNKWYMAHRDGPTVLTVVPADGRRATYENQSTLTISDVRESDTNLYCCGENPELCRQSEIHLSATDLQVMVFPATEGQTVTLMCSTSCRLTEPPLTYIWYRNGEFLYDDWSPWYQKLVSGDQAVTYSCAIKGYEELRAPEVSVDSVTSACFKVTYANGRMCSYNEDEPCSITYPKVTVVERNVNQARYVTLACATSCAQTELESNRMWYKNRCSYLDSHQLLVQNSSNASFSCAFQGAEHLLSPEVCVADKNCRTVNYVNRRICALEGSLVNIVSEYSHPDSPEPASKLWYKSSEGQAEAPVKAGGRTEYRDEGNQHVLRISNLKSSDSGEYTFRLQKTCRGPGVTLTVTGLKVRPNPDVATEGERVTLTCGTTCPLSGSTTHIWYMNGEALTLPDNQNKHLVLDPVSSEDAGNYSCAVRLGKRNISSSETALTVTSVAELESQTLAAAGGTSAALLVITTLAVFWCIHSRKKTCRRSPKPERSAHTDQLNSGPLYENICARATLQEDHHYGRLVFSEDHTQDLYCTMNEAV